ncbi:MAG TPA: CDP-alcohol phosphatidyltransferase family protein [Aeromonadales bacterium]|nr:CDP-alcohol phosphatidyltransferase family protein [Aeromonadales bacterium]
MNIKNIPNMITLLRVALMPPLLYLLLEKNYVPALVIFMIAGASDGLDGYLAKKYHWTSRFGAIADPLADKLLMLVSYGYLTYAGYLPLWLFYIVVGRDVFIVSAAYSFHRYFGPFDMNPTLLSKLNTVLQILLVTYVMYSLVFINIPSIISQVLIYTVGIICSASALQYLWIGLRETSMRLKQQKEASDDNQ